MAQQPRTGSIDDSYHYPPDVLVLLVDTLVRINRSKRDVIMFFRGAGVTSPLLTDWEDRLRTAPDSVRKADIAREMLSELNQRRGNEPLRLRREMIKRVVEFEEFSACWENDRLEAQGLVAQVRALVNAKDTLTRIDIERKKEREARIQEADRRAHNRSAKKQERDAIRRDLFALFAEPDAHKRGIALEGVLNRLFDNYGILVRESFRRRDNTSSGTVEQIDGVIDLDGNVYLVEMKWCTPPVGVDLVSQHLVRVYGRGGDTRGLIISSSDYTDPAITIVREALGQKIVALARLSEIVALLENEHDLRELIRRKAYAAQLDKNPMVQVFS